MGQGSSLRAVWTGLDIRMHQWLSAVKHNIGTLDCFFCGVIIMFLSRGGGCHALLYLTAPFCLDIVLFVHVPFTGLGRQHLA